MSDATDRQAAMDELIDKAEVFSLPALGSLGEKQAETATVAGVITQSGDIIVTVTANGMSNSPKIIDVAVEEDDTAYDVATLIRQALEAEDDINGFFDVDGLGANVQLIRKEQAANDDAMNIAVANDTSEGLIDNPVSLTSVEGEAPDTVKIDRILDRHKWGIRWAASATVTVGQRLLPITPNGRIYEVTIGGVLGTTEPFTTTSPLTIVDGTATLKDVGSADDNVYDILGAVIEAWEAKTAIASRFMGSGSSNMGRIYDNCKHMIDYYQSTPLVG